MSASFTCAEKPQLDSRSALPKSLGEIREVAGQLQYLNPTSRIWVPAVRLQSIRLRIIQQSLLQGNRKGYTFPKSHGDINGQNPADYTSFLLKDQKYGEDRATRNPILFQLKPTQGGQKPTRYVTDSGSIVLDPFDHGIRDFGNDIPLCLSSHIDGRDVETYMRRNAEISFYDLIARMPDTYLEGKTGRRWHDGPPRVGTISMRATRFRLKAGCLSWNEKGDTAAKNAKMLSLMPASCQAKNSTRKFRDLTKQEQDACETAKGKRGNKARKINRKANSQDHEDSGYEAEGDNSGESSSTAKLISPVPQSESTKERDLESESEASPAPASSSHKNAKRSPADDTLQMQRPNKRARY